MPTSIPACWELTTVLEALSSAAEAALRGIDLPVISGLSELEFCSLIAKKRRLKELTTQQAQKILGLFGSHVSGGFLPEDEFDRRALLEGSGADWVDADSTSYVGFAAFGRGIDRDRAHTHL